MMADTPIQRLILAARAEGGDDLADAAEAQLRGLIERDVAAQVAALREATDSSGMAVATCVSLRSGTTWTVTLYSLSGIEIHRSPEPTTLSAAIAAIRAAAQPALPQAAE